MSQEAQRSTYTLHTFAERPDLGHQIAEIHNAVWHRFLNEDEMFDRAWGHFFSAFAPLRLAMCDETGSVVAAARSVPLVWDGALDTLPEGWYSAADSD